LEGDRESFHEVIRLPHSKRSGKPRARAFTLIEIVVALTIISVIAAVAIPTMRGLDRDEKARAPIKTLAEVVQEVRQRAMEERRAYQIVFEREGFHASAAMYPYEKRDEFLKHLEELRLPPMAAAIQRPTTQRQEVANGRPEAGAPPEPPGFEMPWTLSVPLAEGTECEVLMWGDGEWDLIEGEKLRRWVFQPTGMANPAQVRLRTRDSELEGRFDLLTGEMTGERARIVRNEP
jgi:prepilin-type N-terminal cleavage/methylation domain-containing protein